MEELTYIPYIAYEPRNRNAMMDRSISYFTSNGRRGVNLQNALTGRTRDMDRKNDSFFERSGDKVGVRIAINGYRAFTRQKYARGSKNGNRVNLTRAQVAKRVAEVVRDFVEEAADMKACEGQLRFGPGGLELKDLYLLELHQVGATVQPVLGYYAPVPQPQVIPVGPSYSLQVAPANFPVNVTNGSAQVASTSAGFNMYYGGMDLSYEPMYIGNLY